MTNCNVSALHCSFASTYERLSLLDQYRVSFVFALNRDVYPIVFFYVQDSLIVLRNHFSYTFLMARLYILVVESLLVNYQFLFYATIIYVFELDHDSNDSLDHKEQYAYL